MIQGREPVQVSYHSRWEALGTLQAEVGRVASSGHLCQLVTTFCMGSKGSWGRPLKRLLRLQQMEQLRLGRLKWTCEQARVGARMEPGGRPGRQQIRGWGWGPGLGGGCPQGIVSLGSIAGVT